MEVKDLKPAEYNPRQISDEKLAMLGKAMKEFGDLSGIVFNRRTGRLVGGHQRIKHLDPKWKVEKKPLKDSTGTVAVGFVVAPGGKWTYREVDWTEKKEMAANIAANKHGGEFILPDLRGILQGLNDGSMDLDLTGFAGDELLDIFGSLYKKGRIGDDEIPEVKEKIARPGDCFALGPHRLTCGDTRAPGVLEALMGNKKAEMVFTDPPYNVNYGSTMKDKFRNRASRRNAGRKILNDNFASNKDFFEFLRDSINSLRSFVAGDVYICMSSSELHTLQKAFLECGGHWSTFIIWVKNTFTIGRSNYQRQYEPILYGWFDGSSHHWSGKRNLGDVIKDKIRVDDLGIPWIKIEDANLDVWEFPKPQKNKLHPTMKPVELCIRGIVNSSRPKGLVLDAFLGSGSTLISCEKTDRVCYGVELDPHFCDVVIKRWEEFTGKKAKKI